MTTSLITRLCNIGMKPGISPATQLITTRRICRAIADQLDVTPYGTLTVVRDSGFISSGCDMGIYVDGKLAAKLGTKERVTFKIPAGEIVLGAGVIGSGLCGTAADRREREITMSVGKIKNYRVFISSEADVDTLPSTL
jgi:hypothetical protein